MNRNEILAAIAFGFKNVKEQSENKGQMVELFQSSTKVHGPWCLSFVWYCIDRVDEFFQIQNNSSITPSMAHRGAHVVSFFNSSKKLLCPPKTGSIICWQMYKDNKPTSSGHCGIIVKTEHDKIITIEGNTSSLDEITREGDGVELKRRSIYGSNTMRILGFIDPWG